MLGVLESSKDTTKECKQRTKDEHTDDSADKAASGNSFLAVNDYWRNSATTAAKRSLAIIAGEARASYALTRSVAGAIARAVGIATSHCAIDAKVRRIASALARGSIALTVARAIARTKARLDCAHSPILPEITSAYS